MTEPPTDETDQLPRFSDRHRLALADAIALELFGEHLDDETPIGKTVLATVGRNLTLPMADAVLKCPGFTYTGGES